MEERWRQRLSELPDQFVLNESQEPPFDTWVSIPVGAYMLHAHPRTTIRKFSNGAPESWVIGLLAARDDETITPELCPPGQYVVVTATEVFSDVGSLMQAFFSPSTRTVASSLRLLTSAGDKAASPELYHGSRPDWIWGPRTTFPGIDFLLPTQVLDLETFKPRFRPLPQPSTLPPAKAADALASALCQTYLDLAATGQPILIAMTGGLDSRTLLAAALRSGIEFETYTMVSPHVHHKDLEIAKRITERLGVRHTILPMGKLDMAELRWSLWFSGGQSVMLDADFHAGGLWNRFEPGAIYVRGLGFALGRHKYRDFLTLDDETLIRTDPGSIWKKFTRPWIRRLHAYNRKAFDAYAAWLGETLERSRIDFRDRIYLEQGIGSALAGAEHGLAATGTQRISPANSTQVFELLLQERQGSKKHGPLQRDMIRSIDASLLDYPFIKPTRTERLYYRALDSLRALRVGWMLRSLR